jgi:hypothetical protein
LFPLCIIFENGHTLILAWDREIIKQKKTEITYKVRWVLSKNYVESLVNLNVNLFIHSFQ